MKNKPLLRVLVVDDSALYRKVVRDVLRDAPAIEVVGTASNGRTALAQIRSLKPDVVTLDFEMPMLDGIGVLKQLAQTPDAPAAIMVSAFTAAGADSTTKALREGAFDFILKPATKSMEESIKQLRHDLIPKLEACRNRLGGKRARRPASGGNTAVQAPPATPQRAQRRGVLQKPQIVGIAVSTGGPQALTRLLPKIPANFPCPIVMVQHMPPMFTASLAKDLDARCSLNVVEGAQEMPVEVGKIIVAPGGKQMRVGMRDSGPVIEITNDPPEHNCKPAADYLFRSIAEHFEAKTLAVVLTGMGDDGTLGCQEIKRRGGIVIAQDEASCVVYGMPRSVVENGLADAVAPLETMAARMTSVAERRILV